MIKLQVLLIAAGESKRMGQPKQLLAWQGKTLIEHQIEVLQKAHLSLTVVLGAKAEIISKSITNLDVQIVENANWREGMGTSIACGVKEICNLDSKPDGVLIALVDQPLIAVAHFEALIANFEPRKQQIIMSESETGLRSAPVIFDAYYFEALRRLQGDIGAKQIIKKHENKVKTVLCKSSLEDVDTMDSYRRMLEDFSS
ncbi:nucleotidyltransferase family protein [Formosa sp. A9]|uniref:nucleotidyltransferase family protein n=1 Tax=Formosa sp. A9 TaxID=3442641 RepID=UPI003EBD09E0